MHLSAAQTLVGVKWYKIRPYPHFMDGKLYFASIQYILEREPTEEEQAIISIAPRAAGLIACIALPFVALTGWWWLMILVAGGVVDTFVGSLGIREHSDLRRAAKNAKMSPWQLRAAGMVAVFCSWLWLVLALL